MINSVGLNPIESSHVSAAVAMPNTGIVNNRGFQDVLSEAIQSVHELQATSKNLQQRFQLGDESVSIEETMVAMNQASLSFQMLAQTRNKLSQAYSEIMNMPV